MRPPLFYVPHPMCSFVGADDSVRSNTAQRCHSEPVLALAWESVFSIIEENGLPRRACALLAMTRAAYNSATAAHTAPMTALPAAIHSGGVM